MGLSPPAAQARRARGFGAVLCDLDGTLADTLGGLHATASALRAAHGLGPATAAQVRTWVGEGAGVFVARALTGRREGTLAPDLQALAEREFHALYAARVCHDLRAYPGVAATLARLRCAGAALACVTNKPADHARAVLAALFPADTFAVLVTPDDGHGRKPAAGPVRAACTALGVAPDNALMVGDSALDIAAAHAAGCAAVHVRYGYGGAAPDADAQVHAFAEVAWWWRSRIGPPSPAGHRHGH